MTNSFIKASYKTGVYAGEKIDEKNDKTLMKVAAVLKHPMQGDLHQPRQVDVPLFHERKALAEHEKVWVPTPNVKAFDEEIPPYRESLLKAVVDLENDLTRRNDDYSVKSLETLKELKRDYRIEED
ncbi:sporulation phosphorelay system protein KapB [Salibacterium qingdaonense]|uniref:Kinase-associated protein B n=1 Tax=Salibacterium qingdaonense TaxID=266892 RepID=A0A1I4K0I0_9BACI|nr:sporulation phosphorelay system protein KapB [Salibacterium qingdaonense]SFL72204.1 kinase-associated protein B [Salibacterium qingdaonense]